MNEFWATFCVFGFVACIVYLLNTLFKDHNRLRKSLREVQAANKAAAIRSDLDAAENAFNNAYSQYTYSAALKWSAEMSKASADIAAAKGIYRKVDYAALRWLCDE